MGASRQLLLRLNNTASNSGRLFSSSAALTQRPRTHFSDDSEVPHGESAVYKRVLKLQRPTTVKYEECFPISVSLIGAIEFPFKVCSTDRFGVYTAVRVNALPQFWVHVKEVNFVSRNGMGSAYQNLVNLDQEVSFEEIKQKSRDSLHLWQIFFASPSEWWDNRNHKKNQELPTLSTRILARPSGSKTMILRGSVNNSSCTIQDCADKAQVNTEMLGHIYLL